MDTNFLESFITIAENGSFTKAATKLGYSQSTISFQIRQLEETLGAPLFDRVNNRVSLTQFGQDALAVAHRMITDQKRLTELAGRDEGPLGLVRIAMAASLCRCLFSESYAGFRTSHPGISLKVVQGGTTMMFRMLKENEADFVYTLDRHLYDSRHNIAFEHPVDTHFVAPPGMFEETSMSIRDLMGLPFILTEKNMSYRMLLDEQLAARSLEIDPFMEIGDTSLICGMVSDGLGLSFLPDYVTSPLVREGKLARLEVGDFCVETWIQIIYRRDKYVSPQMQCVIDYLGDTTSRLLS